MTRAVGIDSLTTYPRALSRPLPVTRFFLPLLLLAVAGCDQAEPEPEAFFVATARDVSGAPVAGLDLFLTYGSLVPDDARRADPRTSGQALDLSAPFPNPTRNLSRVSFSVPEPQDLTLRLFDVAGEEVAILFEEAAQATTYSVVVDVSAHPAGVYRLTLEGANVAVDRYLIVSDAEGEGPIGGLAVFLGTTDANGRVLVDDRTRFPSLFNIPTSHLVTDDTANVLGEFVIGAEAGLVLQDAGGRTAGRSIQINDAGVDVELTFYP